ncbi:CDP-alcohol phosphatidyltransferase family protein [Aminobacter ciceronei]|uniref:Phosphatidylglycerophosphate synthase n=1 Tax=Aminobacter ciceronei TaxID=150723 RepID=A0ABR6C8U4_9HYPH|nr:CDP-alcohol phosphatidyltransferase family protein [Aminobacter ciceronei]MBA8907545.1 phosphatidylglycerophosphate synthase [Aminobacter ciceronei]MBA9021354.1 phosphatidylglycerophosphate synthase [Aminobacter ciceronei]
MFDRHLQPLQMRLLNPPAAWLCRRGISADTVTLFGFAMGISAVPLLASGHPTAALLVILVNRALDGLDGALARRTKPTDRGAFLDIALDFVFYALVPFGFALADPGANALAAATLLLAFVGTGSSFLAFAAIAGRQGLVSMNYPAKGIYYLGGLTEGAETIAVFVAMCAWPSAFPAIAYGYAALCAMTTITRWWWGWRAFARSDRPASIRALPKIAESRRPTRQTHDELTR